MAKLNKHLLADAFTRQKHLDRFIVHLRQRRTLRNLNLVIGAGATLDAGAPLWGDLIERLRKEMAKETRVRVGPLASFNPAMAAEVLLKWLEAEIENDTHYKKHKVPANKKFEYAHNRWINSIRKVIYRKVPDDNGKRLKKHPYLRSLACVVARCPITINFNFDDVVDRATQAICAEHALDLPNIVWKLPLGYQSKGATILHINGYLPRGGKADSERLVLTEGAFAELMLQQTDYQSISLLRAFAESTMLILGCSLNDSSLKAILRSSAQINATNFHYIVHFIGQDEKEMRPHFQKVFEANRSVYNLITIFLRRDEIGPFLDMLAGVDESQFEVALKELNPDSRSKLLFYIVGAVGSGKTTLIRNLRLFQTHEEWGAQPPEEMYRDPSTLTIEEKRRVDMFLKAQLRHKNETMRKADIGFHVMDRGYLDLIAFSDRDHENKLKLDTVETFVAGDDGLQDGVIIRLHAKAEELEDSQWDRGQLPKRFGGSGYTINTLRQQQEILEAIYQPSRAFDARKEDSASVLARNIAFDILTGEYAPMEFNDRVEYIRGGNLKRLYKHPGVTATGNKSRSKSKSRGKRTNP